MSAYWPSLRPEILPTHLAPQPQKSKFAQIEFYVADDLTGSLEVAAALWKFLGMKVAVVSHDGELSDFKNFDAIVINSQVRDLGNPESALAVTRFIRTKLRRLGHNIPRYLKIDSTLKQVDHALGGFLKEGEFDRFFFIPAYPRFHRYTTDEGVHEARNREEKGPYSQETHLDLFKAFDQKFRIPAEAILVIPGDVMQGGKTAILEWIQGFNPKEKRVIIPTILNQEDLHTMAEVLDALEETHLVAGSAGILRAQLELRASQENIPPNRYTFGLPRRAHKAPLIVNGSENYVTRMQIVRSLENQWPEVVSAPLSQAVLKDSEANIEILNTRRILQAALSNGRPAILTVKTEKRHVSDYAHPEILDGDWSTLKHFGEVLMDPQIANTTSVLWGSGGTTLLNLLNGIGVKGLRLVGEFKEGFPISEIIGGPYDGIKVLSKAGGFGVWEDLEGFIQRACLPKIAITTGDPLSIGPEITILAFLNRERPSMSVAIPL